jgi:translation initiation factor 4G
MISYLRILNKLTPDKFDKLSLELLNVGIESQQILKGIILLVSANFREI